MCACASSHPAIFALLLSHNADLCAVNDRGQTALHIAAFLGSLSILQELLTSSSNDEIILKAVNQSDNQNQTPLFYACIEGHLDVALNLFRIGANAYHLDNDNQTCLHAMLSSSVILKRHIRLFYYFIQFVDYRLNRDYLDRTLLDLAYVNQLNTIINLLKLLNYKTNSDIVSNDENDTNRIYDANEQVLSLRHICILYFKRSIIYHRNRPQATQRDLLENALQQTFQIVFNSDSTNIKESKKKEYFVGKSLDDISLLQQSTKYQKHIKSAKNQDKKMRKTSGIFSTTSSTNKWASQVDLQHSHSTWSVLTQKLKGQRLPPATTHIQQTPICEETNPLQLSSEHPMKNFALEILTSPKKLHSLLDVPSLNHNLLLYDDLKMSMNKYNLLSTDLLNQVFS